ncbi:hypothetical protein F4561_006557 [Lipingzhangella halophila]|uniref:Tail terminator n=1 Tax=Lipingzhangella halophila TaxID=1783352 RepID=A0A7W7RQ95_9ACTN|nr:hypothetical protein [Lipingzhangella halophila]MBB4935648.1 hypothetical protein [Lipingzhangella halophila]
MAFPDIFPPLRAHLLPVVDPVPVVTRVPDPRPERLVQMRRVGGQAQAPVRDRARFDVWCWAPTDDEAMGLALDVRGALWALSGTDQIGPPVYRVEEFLGPRHDDDPTTSSPRVWATYELTIRADSAIYLAP